MDKKNKILIICGPTASGKSELAVRCAKLLNSEIIYADALDVYRGLDIGTAKPTKEEKNGIIHHLIDVADVNSSFSVGDYKELAEPIVEDLLSRGKVPVICGGTGFYINSLIYDFSYGKNPSNLVVREKYMKLAEEKGKEFVFSVLEEKDPESAKTLHPNDLKRVVRALEIYESGIKKSEIKDSFVPIRDYAAYSINFDRETLYERIDLRVDKMFNDGLLKEVKKLIDCGVTIKNQCMQGIGYKETYAYLSGELSLDEAKDLIKKNTKHYAKRQITFFKKLPGLKYLQPQSTDVLAERIVKEL